ncbi:ABC transporter ATP-binding protein [Lentilactobacillus parabuchneri]|jgi:putative ABC transport system ATP-binding protein|uniref:ATP-binding cassette domain-containing protein n=3 Tax=Lentilactobacillus TaxID=2767893 RepID=A0A844EB10_9LACO|nr:ABC transporter ATP-binding protein [Lentilactobacillus parabuchneri]KRM45953.1 phosphonate-transporting ATPase [Lentilactobacillus parabuchneri DSM 5707 = NBRC 107865]KRN79660.1 phosphonate-transporting ATPase [Lentilactobacillus parabuchneri]MBW0223423.1 ABC transporter ATP-binding protein [Lentilactobacillus parabuchneri]MBW0246074.1 ABC transporter ATP-binding protein [Lentilactobacillus parabuchneri]MCT2884905.1 ABC transporter ATP-binding protein [Lentilactobacillus parabuchneri]
MAYIDVKHVSKIYGSGEQEVRANDDINFEIKKGELTIIVGASGAGKSTLLNILGGMDTPTKGDVIVNGKDISNDTPKQLTTYRRLSVGFVFQFYNLIPNLTALENVELASQISPDSLDVAEVMAEVGLAKRTNNFPAQLSGGEQQRVAIARAIAKNPDLLLCDEPTGALDYKTGKSILKLLQDFSNKTDKNVIIVTHNGMIKPMADHIIEIGDGQVKNDELNHSPKPVEEIEW